MTSAPASGPISPPVAAFRLPAWLAAALIVVATLLVYSNTLRSPFVFDDEPAILQNSTIRQLWPLTSALQPDNESGSGVAGRPVVNLSLAVDYAISGLDPWSYHATNLLIHALAALTLFGLVRRTLAGPVLGVSFAELSVPLAGGIALLWAVHPLLTESVTCVIQRTESLVGLFYLFTLYAYLRAALATTGGARLAWSLLSVATCVIGMGTKEVMVTAPVIALLYDRTFVSGTFRGVARQRWLLYGLFATWALLLYLIQGNPMRGGTAGYDQVSGWDYLLTQCEALLVYLKLSFWPHPLIMDYGNPVVHHPLEVLPQALVLLALLGATLWALRRRPVLGFLGAWWFVVLAPSSSVVPLATQTIAEHRMYLPLAAIIALVLGVAAARLGRRALVVLLVLPAVAAGFATWQRNFIYQDEERLWRETMAEYPENARLYNNLGRYYYGKERFADAIACYLAALQRDPGMRQAHFNLGLALRRSGRLAEAVAPLEAAIRILPEYHAAQLNLAITLAELGKTEEALFHFDEAARSDPRPAEVHFQWGVALARLKRWPEAISHYKHCLWLDPRHAEAQGNWANALVELGLTANAIEHFQTALRLRPESADLHFNLAVALSAVNRGVEALHHYEEAVRLKPAHATAHLNLGIALGQSGRLPEAIGHLEAAVRLQPQNPQANYNLGYALVAAGRAAEARPYFETTLRLRPDFSAAREMLRQLGDAKTP